MEEFLTAEEARNIAQHSIDTSNLNKLKDINEGIKVACSMNHFYIYVYTTLSTSVINHLKNRGYSIEDLSSQKDGACFKINW
jgi:hypothetical protein